MRPRNLSSLLLMVSLLLTAARVDAGRLPQATATAQARAAVESKVRKLSPDVRARARALLEEPEERRRAQLAAGLARSAPAALTEFLIAFLRLEGAASVRLAIVDSLGRHSSIRIRAELARLASSDADLRVSLLALERLRAQLIQDGRDLLDKRLELARRSNDQDAVSRLSAEQERWISLVRGTMLPAFLRVPPPRFPVKEENQTVRLLAFGDFGTGSQNQRQVASAMLEWHRKTPFDFGITLGDNFYIAGMTSPADSRWKTQWEELYGSLGIKFYATLGNHDWVLSDSPAAEILYSEHSASWRIPSPYYTFTAGPVQLFALDTNEMSEAQLIWLGRELKASTSKWKIVYGHHPIYSDGEHGDGSALAAKLLPLLNNRVDAYLAGHDHILNHLKAEGGVEFFISGGAGAGLYRVKPQARSLYSESKNGFAVIEADSNSLKVRFIGSDAIQLYEYSIRK